MSCEPRTIARNSYHRAMTRIPESFPAYVVDRPEGGPFSRGLRELPASDLPAGEVTVRVEWSGVNFKDGLAAREDGRVARSYPLVPGIDLAGTVAASEDPAIAVGSAVLANGYDIGTARHGGFAAYARIPADWVVPMPEGLTARDAMAIGTAGFTAAMSVAALEERGLRSGDGPVLVTGASGGVGSSAVAILAATRSRGLGGDRQARRARPAACPRGGRRPRRGTRSPRPGDRSTRRAGPGPSTRSARRRCRTCCGRCATAPRSPPRGTRAAPTSRRRSSRSSSAAWRCSGWTRPTCRSRRAAPCGAASRRTCGRAGWTTPSRRSTLATLEPALDAIVDGEARGRWVVRVPQ